MDNADQCMKSEIRYPWIMYKSVQSELFSVNRHHNLLQNDNKTIYARILIPDNYPPTKRSKSMY